MFFSEETGYYSLRLETILRVVQFEADGNEYGKFVKFEPVTPRTIRAEIDQV